MSRSETRMECEKGWGGGVIHNKIIVRVSESQTKTGTRPDVVSSSVLLRYIGFNVQCRILLMERITHHPQQCNFSILRESCVCNQLQEFH
jgi:hypothetical protein